VSGANISSQDSGKEFTELMSNKSNSEEKGSKSSKERFGASNGSEEKFDDINDGSKNNKVGNNSQNVMKLNKSKNFISTLNTEKFSIFVTLRLKQKISITTEIINISIPFITTKSLTKSTTESKISSTLESNETLESENDYMDETEFDEEFAEEDNDLEPNSAKMSLISNEENGKKKFKQNLGKKRHKHRHRHVFIIGINGKHRKKSKGFHKNRDSIFRVIVKKGKEIYKRGKAMAKETVSQWKKKENENKMANK
jgi:hypothetical protein